MKNIITKIKNYMKTHCLFFWHDYKESDEKYGGMLTSERQYWTLEKCTKCSKRRIVLL